MKHDKSMKIQERAQNELVSLLSAISAVKIVGMERVLIHEDLVPDFLIGLEHTRKKYHLVCEVKSNGQPRHIRNAIEPVAE